MHSFVSPEVPRTLRHLIAVALILAGAACAARGQSMPGYQAPSKPVARENLREKAARGEAPLNQLYSNLSVDSKKIKRLGPLTSRERNKRSEKVLRIGVVRRLGSPLKLARETTLHQVPEGDLLLAGIVSSGARRLRVHFQNMSLPPGARVFVYSKTNRDDFAGPYENRGPVEDGNFWTPPLAGEEVVIEYFAPNGLRADNLPFQILEVSHAYKDAIEVAADLAGSCNLEVTPEWSNVAKSVGMLDFVTNGFEAVCTGTLLNDSNPSFDHYVLTANHCINTQSEAQSAFMYWNYLTGDVPPNGTPTSAVPSLMVHGTASDFSLLRFGSVPAGLFFSGWDANPVSASTSITGIHHPEGSHKRISFGATNANCVGGLPGPCGNFNGVTWSQGVTEPGSSGSGIWTGSPADPKLVGTLFGGESSCAAPSASDYYGRFSVTYPNVAGFLNGTGCVTSVTPNSQSFPSAGGGGSFTVNAPAGCSWTPSSTVAWITITSGSGTGNGTVNFSVAANTSLQRSGSIVVGTTQFTINQAAGGSCAPAPTAIGQTINGNLAPSDCQLDDGSFADAYSFTAATGQKISISMSAGFDTFLALLNPDGSILAADDDGGGGTNSRIPAGAGFFTIPAAGTYTILANSFDPGVTGSYSLTLAESPKQTLTITSTGTGGGVNVTVNPVDVNGASDGTTSFSRTFYRDTTVVLNAPGAVGAFTFQKWTKDGVDWSSSPVTLVPTEVDHTMTAVYVPTPTFELTVASTNPGSGVPITLNALDNNGNGSGTTQFTRIYNLNTFVLLDAPLTAGGNIFLKWQKDGADFTASRSASVSMNAAHTMTAVYRAASTVTLTVASQNPSSGVNITVSPNDNGGLNNGTTQFTRNFPEMTEVTLTVPETVNGSSFDRWLRNGNGLTFSRTATTFLDANVTMTAVFIGGSVTEVQLSAANYAVNEADGGVTVTVNRSGNLTLPTTVNYRTVDVDGFTSSCAAKQGTAFGRCDFATTVGALTFGSGESSKTFTVPIINDGFAEGNETFSVVLSNVNGGNLGSPATAVITISDNETVDAPNPMLQPNTAGVAFFVRQNYLDFLGREPEPGEPWSNLLRNCSDQFNINPNSPAASCDRLTVSGSFFGSPEFRDKGIFVIDFYRVAFNRLPTYTEFSQDLASITGATSTETFARRAVYANAFVQRSEFTGIYDVLSAQDFVNNLMAGARGQAYNLTSITTPDPNNPDGPTKVTLTTTDLINRLLNLQMTRAQVLRAIVQSDQITQNAESVNAFVASQYYGYLRRTPDTAGFNSWVNHLRNNPSDFRTMVNGFANSQEYRLRFGP